MLWKSRRKAAETVNPDEISKVFDAPTAIDGDLVIVYVTKLGPDTTGRFRAMVSEVQVLR